MTNTPKIKKRDRERTKGLILKAVGQVIHEHGTDKLGINLVARTAGVNKVLIYRYFKSIDGLMEQFVASGEYAQVTDAEYINTISITSPDNRPDELINTMHKLLGDLRDRKATRDLLKWEIASGKSVLSEARNEVARKVFDKIGGLENFPDTEALMALITAAVYYLTISSDYRNHMIHIDIQSEEGWKRIENVIENIIRKAAQ